MRTLSGFPASVFVMVPAGHKKTGPKAGFSFLDPELLGDGSSRSGSVATLGSRSSSGVSSRRSGSVSSGHSGVSSRRSGVSSRRSCVSSRSSGVSSRGFYSRRFSSRGFFFLTTGGHGNSQQSSQEDGIFHLISLYIPIN
jgi:hypothetical protein